LAKPPPLGRPTAPPRGRNAQMPRPFPALTPQSYLPGGAGGAGLYPGFPPTGGPSNFPMLTPNAYLPPPGNMEPPIMNFSGGPGMFPPPRTFPPMPLQPPMPYPNQGLISIGPQPTMYDPGLPTYSRRRPVRICRRRGRRRSRRCRPVIHIIDSSSCSSLSSSYTTISSCSRRHHRSRSHSRRRAVTPQQQQQQPIILLPMQCQQSPSVVTAPPVQNQIQQQPQQIILPPIHIQQPGQFQQQQLALPSIPLQQQQLALSPLQFQQQPITLPPIQLNSSNFAPSTSSSPMMIASGQPMIQPSISMPQIANIGQSQQIQSGPFQYVQAVRQSSSPLQYIAAEPRSTIAPQRVLVNSTNKRQSATMKPVPRSTSIRDVPQNDLKYGRRPFDWYANEKKTNIINENIRIGQRGSTAVR
jgi:hypothetical protein